jgi:hypothetical protein
MIHLKVNITEDKAMSAYHTMLTKIWNGYENLTLYELTFKVNNDLLKGKEISPAEREYIVKRFIGGVSSKHTVERFHKGVKAEDNGNMYPFFYIPPYNDGKKYVTISTITPKTQILSANSYELEILRLLALLSPNNEQVMEMLERTKKRLSDTCFGKFCEAGECFEASLVALRFLSTAYPNEINWIQQIIRGFNKHAADKKRHSGVNFYYWLILSELPDEIAKPEVEKHKDFLLKLLNKSFVMNSEHDRYASPFGKYVLRNCLAKLNEYADIKNIEPYVSEKDGRINIDIQNYVI